jgi:Zn ribbon nucleic-acid-binding protein
MIFDGVRRWWESVIAQEKAEFDAAHIARAPALVLRANDDCPQCSTSAAMREVAAGTLRCFQCGHQNEIRNPPGSINRKSLDTFQDFDAEHKRKFAHGFVQALSRFRK